MNAIPVELKEHSKRDIQSAIESIAGKYRVDLDDPIFSVLEKVDEYHKEVKQAFTSNIQLEIETLRELNQTFQIRTHELNQAALKLSEAQLTFETNVNVVAESTQGLIRYWKQIHWHHALIGMGVSLILCGGLFSLYYYKSADRLLSQAGVTLKSEKSKNGHKITLSGKNLLEAGKSNSDVVLEYAL